MIIQTLTILYCITLPLGGTYPGGGSEISVL